ncbi:MAG: TIGR03084 family protein [Actinobacteria bacterium]|nr:TIGR03084 family protein [Actinomycetota bacterium]
MDRVAALLADLADETASLDAVIARLDDATLMSDTPAEGWTIVDQLSHLAGFDAAAVRAMVDPGGFAETVASEQAAGIDPVERFTELGRELEPHSVLDWWHSARHSLIAAAGGIDRSRRVPWYGPEMSVMSFLSARLMETWAHGQDIRDALGVPAEPSQRLRHVAHLGVGARAYSLRIHRLDGVEVPVFVELTAPDGELWTWGEPSAADSVRGTALDFCLAVTQRRHLDDLALDIVGAGAQTWMSIAQAFAGGAGTGRPAR